MKRRTNRVIPVLLLGILLFQAVPFAASAEEEHLGNNPDYVIFEFMAVDVQRDEQTGVITFKNGGSVESYPRPDTNTYVIDENTITDSIFVDLDALVRGEHKWIAIIFLKKDFWAYDETIENRMIHVGEVISTHVGVKVYPPPEQTQAAERLNEQGILQYVYGDEQYGVLANVSRAEMARAVVGMLGMTVEQTETAYADVPKDHWASGYIAKATELGIVCGRGGGTFDPDWSVTGGEAIKMVVAALGYEAQAQEQGGYPDGYIAVAGELGILDDLMDAMMDEHFADRYLIRGRIACLIEDAMNLE